MGNYFYFYSSAVLISGSKSRSHFFFFAHLTFSISFRFLTFTAKNHAQCFPISLTELQWLCSHCLKYNPLVVRGQNEASSHLARGLDVSCQGHFVSPPLTSTSLSVLRVDGKKKWSSVEHGGRYFKQSADSWYVE